jgi:tetratricopeptide (TPR) repeat protein
MDLREQLQVSLGDAYTLERELGGGGMSRVFVAREERLERSVVVKVLSPELAQGISLSRFEREIITAAVLQQANIVPVLSAGDTGGLPYFTMPFVEGESLRSRLAGGPLGITEVIGILRDVGKALAYAHSRNFVHRDIKPDNVLLSGGTAVVTDFGIARAISASRTGVGGGTLTQVGTSIGTPAYMAPEQAAGDPSVDHRVDIYALGCLAYELLTGQSPFAGRTPQRMLAAHMAEPPRSVSELRPDAPATLANLVMLCLEKDANNRPQSATDVVRVLETMTSGSGLDATSAALTGRQLPLWQALAIWAVSFGAVFVLASAAIVGIGLPEWVLPSALIVAGLGLPAVLATYYVQRVARRAITATPTITPGGSRRPHGTLATVAMHAAPVVTWRRTWSAGAIVVAAFVIFVGAFMGMRAFGIGSVGSLFGKGLLKPSDKIVLAQFTTRGVDSALAPLLTEALRADLTQSKAIVVLQPSAIRDALGRMQRPTETVLDAAVGREIAQREGAKLVVVSAVAPLGPGFVLSAELLEPQQGDPVVSVHATANGPNDLMAAVGRLSRDVRAKIGESLRDLQASPRLERVSTSSLEAFRKYQQAVAFEYTPAEALSYPLLLEAVRLDTTFAMAYRKLGVIEVDHHRQVEFFTKAFRYRERLSDVERYQAEAMYYQDVSFDFDRAIDAHIRATRADSTVLRPYANITDEYRAKRQYDEALVWAEKAEHVDTRTLGRWSIEALLNVRRPAAAESILARVKAIDGEQSIQWWEGYLRLRLNQAQYDSLASTVARLRPIAARDPTFSVELDFVEHLFLDMVHGRMHAAQEFFTQMQVKLARAGGSAETPVDAALRVASVGIWFRNDSADIERVERLVAETKFEQMPVENRPYLVLATLFALAHRVDRAKAFITLYDTEVRDTLQRRRDMNKRLDAVGWIALADNRPLDAVKAFTQEADGVAVCHACTQASIGIAYGRAGMTDSSITFLERFFEAPDRFGPTGGFLTDLYFRAIAFRQLGELYEEKGNIGKAVANYASFVDLWKNADSDLQPQVQSVREKLKRLSDTEARAKRP